MNFLKADGVLLGTLLELTPHYDFQPRYDLFETTTRCIRQAIGSMGFVITQTAAQARQAYAIMADTVRVIPWDCQLLYGEFAADISFDGYLCKSDPDFTRCYLEVEIIGTVRYSVRPVAEVVALAVPPVPDLPEISSDGADTPAIRFTSEGG